MTLASASAHAKIFKWVDEKGKTHFTDDPTKIPKKQEDKVETIRELPPATSKKAVGDNAPSNKPRELLNELGTSTKLNSQAGQNEIPNQLDEKQLKDIQEQLESFQEVFKKSQEDRDQQLKAIDEIEGSKTKSGSGKSRYPKY